MATPTAPRPAGPVTPRIPARSPLLAALLSMATLWLGGLAACARMEPPPGGPEDKVRPYVAMVYPGPGATGVSRELKARIAFSEWVNPDAARKVHLSPPPARRLKVEVKGNLLEVTSPAPLDSGTTYVLGVSGTVLDLHGLPLEAPFQLMFSTGATLDSGALAGRISVFPGARPPAGTVAALYPEDPVLRARFSHLGRRVPRPDLSATPSVSSDSQALSALPPVAFRERPAYLAPADSLGAFAFQGVRPGRYLTLAFQDANQDGEPDPGSEPLALGPATTVSAAAGPPASLALAPYDTLPMRLLAARWTHEAAVSGLSHGSLRLSFSRPPHPRRALRRELYSVRRAGATGGAPVLDVAFDPETGEVDLYTSPLKPDTAWRVSLGPVSDLLGNTLDTSRDEATFAVAFPDTARSAAPPAASAASTAGAGSEMGPIFLGSLEASGTRKKLPREAFFPGRGLMARMPRILTDSLLKALSVGLEARIDTVAVPLFLSRVNHHELSLRFGPIPLRGQILTIGPKAAPAPAPAGAGMAPQTPQGGPGAAPAPAAVLPTPTPATSAPAASAAAASAAAASGLDWPKTSFTLADSARLGSLRFRQDASAYGAILILRPVGAGSEILRATPPREEFTVDSLPAGKYAVGYFRDVDGDSLWTPGRSAPWTAQEPFVHFADSVEVESSERGPGDPTEGRLAFPPSW